MTRYYLNISHGVNGNISLDDNTYGNDHAWSPDRIVTEINNLTEKQKQILFNLINKAKDYQTLDNKPTGSKGKVYYFDGKNDTSIISDYILKKVNVVETQEELDKLKNSQSIEDFNNVFTSWKRFSHATNQDAKSEEEDAWSYNSDTNHVVCSINSDTYIGFVSIDQYLNYSLQCTISSTDSDDDVIALVIAFMTDSEGKEHTLSLVRTGGDSWTCPMYSIVYDYCLSTQKVIKSMDVGDGTSYWSSYSKTKLKIIREGDIVKTYTAQRGSTSLLDTSLIEIDLGSDDDLKKFRGACSYGYACHSQNSTTFNDVLFSDGIMDSIYDVNKDEAWEYINSEWKLIADKHLGHDVGAGHFIYNPNSKKIYYVDEYEKINYLASSEALNISNMDVLNNLSEDTNGDLNYNGNPIGSEEKMKEAIEANQVNVLPTFRSYLANTGENDFHWINCPNVSSSLYTFTTFTGDGSKGTAILDKKFERGYIYYFELSLYPGVEEANYCYFNNNKTNSVLLKINHYNYVTSNFFGIKIDTINNKIYFTENGINFLPTEGIDFSNINGDLVFGFYGEGNYAARTDQVTINTGYKAFKFAQPKDSISLYDFATGNLSKQTPYPIKLADDTVLSDDDLIDYAKKFSVNGEKQLLLRKNGEMFLTNGDGTVNKVNDVPLENKNVVSKLSEDTNGDLNYNGNPIGSEEKMKEVIEDNQVNVLPTFRSYLANTGENDFHWDPNTKSCISDEIINFYTYQGYRVDFLSCSLDKKFEQNYIYYFELEFTEGSHWDLSHCYFTSSDGTVEEVYPSKYIERSNLFGIKIDAINDKIYFTTNGIDFLPKDGADFSIIKDDFYFGYYYHRNYYGQDDPFQMIIYTGYKVFKFAQPKDSISLYDFATGSLSKQTPYPVKLADDTVLSDDDLIDYAKKFSVNGEKQLLLRKNGEMFLTNGDGTVNKVNKEYLTSIPSIKTINEDIVQDNFPDTEKSNGVKIFSDNPCHVSLNGSMGYYLVLNNPIKKDSQYSFEIVLDSLYSYDLYFTVLSNGTTKKYTIPSDYVKNLKFEIKIDRINGKISFSKDKINFTNETSFDNTQEDIYIGISRNDSSDLTFVYKLIPLNLLDMIKNFLYEDSLIKVVEEDYNDENSLTTTLNDYAPNRQQLLLFKSEKIILVNKDKTFIRLDQNLENKDVISKLSEDTDGNLLYDGKAISSSDLSEEKVDSLPTFEI